jgi:ribosome-associated protein
MEKSHHTLDVTNEPEKPSKSERKRAMTALQDVGLQLVTLNASQLAQIELPELLHDAVLAAQRISNFEGRRRQLQYIGRLMRNIDAAPIIAKLEQWHGASRENTTLLHQAEAWRERLLTDDNAITQFATAFTTTDLQHLRSLIASVKRDQSQGHPPKKYRELYRVIRQIIETLADAKTS